MNYFAYSDFHHFPIIQHKRMNYFASDFYHFLILKKENGYFAILLNEWIIVDVANMFFREEQEEEKKKYIINNE